ncbi:MAG: leucine-rich repeat domain-containing protein [Chloroflexota bacterium]|nr:leucine-rich repeat domain-containing protein [Chloroflexota bacterium]
MSGDSGESGTLTLDAGIRNFRATESGDVYMLGAQLYRAGGNFVPYTEMADVASVPARASVGSVRAFDRRRGVWSMKMARPDRDAVIGVGLMEESGQDSSGSTLWFKHETLALWVVPENDEHPDRMRFVDILKDSDSDGVGDVNERFAGTLPEDSDSTPGVSFVDVLSLYTAAFQEQEGGYPGTRMLHNLVVSGAFFEDSGTNIRLRYAGQAKVEKGAPGSDDDGQAISNVRESLMDAHGADMSVFYDPNTGWAVIGAYKTTLWSDGRTGSWGVPAVTVHELGHAFGLAHSHRQGVSHGAWRWSRGHIVTPRHYPERRGTIMAYAQWVRGGVFSDPRADCGNGLPCGVDADELDGADAVRTLDIMRFQVAARRVAGPDSDGDGVIDSADAAPSDPNDWFDADGIGDNTDDDTQNLSPFRDPALREAVESALGKEPGAPITRDDMASLTRLHAGYEGIIRLDGLEQAVALEELILAGNQIHSLSPLAGLSRLRLLNLSDNPVSDISALQELASIRILRLNETHVEYEDVQGLPYFKSLRQLSVGGLGVEDLSTLVDLTEVEALNLSNNDIVDLSPLAQLTSLRWLSLSYNAVSDIEPLSDLIGLRTLYLDGNFIRDLSTLVDLTEVEELDLSNNDIVDLSPLAQLTSLRWLSLSYNAVSDIEPLSDLIGLRTLYLDGNFIRDLSTLVDLTEVEELDLSNNNIVDLSPLAQLTSLRGLRLSRNAVSNIGPLSDLAGLEYLYLDRNSIKDPSPLARLTSLRWLDLSYNAVSDIEPLVSRSIFGGSQSGGAYVDLDRNPLDEKSMEEHVSELRSWGIEVRFEEHPAVETLTPVPDPTLRALIEENFVTARQRGGFVDAPMHSWNFAPWTREFRIRGAGVMSLDGLEAAQALEQLFASSNDIADLSPLAELPRLSGLDLRNNRISDLGPLVSNANLGDGDWVNLGGNPLSEESVNEHIPALLERGVQLSASPVLLTLVAGGEPMQFRVSGYFESLLDSGFRLEASVDDASVAAVEVTDGVLMVVPDAAGRVGQANVTVTARGSVGRTETLSLAVTLVGPQIVPLFPADSGFREGFVRVINRGDQAAQARIVAIDDSGARSQPLTLAVGAGGAVHFDAADLEAGNPDKGLDGSSGQGTGDWRLELESAAELDVVPFVRAADGFMTAMHDVAAVSDSVHKVHLFNPASELENTSSLRLVNRGSEVVEAVITGVDDLGQSPGGEVRVEVPAGAAATVTAAELENSGPRLRGRLGDGAGKWRLEVRSEADLIVMNLLSSLDGHLANLSGEGAEPRGDGVHVVPLFLSAADPMGRQGIVRVINRSDSDGVVRIQAYDDEGYAYGPLALSLSVGHAAHFDSRDLELGNVHKGLSGSAGTGIGDWRLELSSDLDIEALAYVRTEDGFLTSVYDGAPRIGRRYEVATFYPAGHVDGTSRLRIVNPGSRPAHVSIAGVDDAGESLGEVVRLSVPAGQSRTVTALQLQFGVGRPSQGALGSGTGMWRLVVDCEQPIIVMNLFESVTGRLSNLSTK